MSVEFKITNTSNNQVHYRYNVNSVYDLIEEMTDDVVEAINVSAWCELASYGETYENTDHGFTVEVCEY